MPTYQYACTACGHLLEAVQSFTDEPLTKCPECAGQLRKQFGSVGVVFKGSGFYRTDSRKGAESKSSSTAATSSSSASSSSDSSSSTSGAGASTTSASAKPASTSAA